MAERQGYGDYQRTVNWDGPQILREFNTHEGVFTSARFNAARFAYLAGMFNSSISSFLITLQWFMEEGGGETIGQREFVLDEGITSFGQIHLPHLGPWFQFTLKGKPATLYGPGILLFNSNRVYPLEFLPKGPVLLQYSHVYAALGEENVFPLSYYSGPMQMTITNTGANVKVTVTIEAETAPGVFAAVSTFNTTSASASTTLYAPVGAWRVNVKVNGATTAGVQLLPFLTGSS
jgi:hypothetical protein